VWHIAGFRKSSWGNRQGLFGEDRLSMQIWPAIDLRDGKCVRLRQGDYGRETVYGDQPVAMAHRWVDEGAEYLHLVDLDGAREGRLINRPAVAAIVAAVGVPCELGGGIRDEKTVADLLSLGLNRLVIGTQAVKRPDWFRQLCAKFPGKLVAGIDARDGMVATDGWLETSAVPATELAAELADLPMAAIVYTDISKDGMMAGPNLAAMSEMAAAVSAPIVASGGVTTADDVAQLAKVGVAGCIIGRALYEGSLTLADALAAAKA
jgi:phosphoribosylformimino-5-aminoimidazole carboxamide ribotide isomerase